MLGVMANRYVAVLLLAPLAVACALRPSLEGRACDEEHPCVAGFHCAAGACVGDEPSTLLDAGREDAGRDPQAPIDAGSGDAGGDDAGVGDGGAPAQCPVVNPPDESWLSSFSVTPALLRPPDQTVTIEWSAMGMDSCSLLWNDGALQSLPATHAMEFLVPDVSALSITLSCTSGDEAHDATRIARKAPAVLDVRALVDRTCVVIEGGVIRCWGVAVATPYPPPPERIFGDSSDEVGEGLRRISLAEEGGDPQGNDTPARSLSLGWAEHDCALLEDGRVKCWGSNGSGELGIESTDAYDPLGGYSVLPAAKLGARRATAVNAGWFATCASFDDGTVGCWGSDSFGQLGNGALTTGAVGDQPGSMGDALYTFQLDEDAGVSSLEGPSLTRCALLQNGELKCWGSNANGSLGQGDLEHRGDDDGEVGAGLAAVDFGAGRTVVDVALSYHACAALDDGSVKCWSRGSDGRLGYGTDLDDAGPDGDLGDELGEMGDALPSVDLGTGAFAVAVTTGSRFSCAALQDGRVKCFGDNGSGRLGLGDTRARVELADLGDALPFTDVGGDVIEVTAGTAHTCALLEDATVKCWGHNLYGQLGLGDTEDRGDEAGEMGADLPRVDVGPLVLEAFTLVGVRRALEREGCMSCHSTELPPLATPAAPPFDGCRSDLVSSGAYDLGSLDPGSDEGRLHCLHWHLTEECDESGAPRRGLVDVRRPDHSRLFRAPLCAGGTCTPPDSSHPVAGFQERRPGSSFSYIFNWISRGAPPAE